MNRPPIEPVPRRHCGTTTVEFAIVGAVVMLTTLAIIEFGRILYTYAMLSETTRRAARVAVVCPRDDAAITAAVTFGGAGPLRGFTARNVAVAYLDANGAPTGAFAATRYVRVTVADYAYRSFLPLPARMLQISGFPVTLPAESLGLVESAHTSCQGG